MVGRQFVGTLIEHLVVADVALHADLAADEVVDQDFLVRLYTEAHDILMSPGNEAVHLLLRQRQRVAHLLAGMAVVLEVLHLSTLLLQLLRGVEGDVCLAVVQQLLDILLIDVAALALTVGTFVATERDTLVELDTQPLETLDDILLGTGDEARGVGVLNAEHQVAAVLAGKQIIIQSGTYTTNMQSPRGTRCKAHPDSSFCHFHLIIYVIWLQRYEKITHYEL